MIDRQIVPTGRRIGSVAFALASYVESAPRRVAVRQEGFTGCAESAPLYDGPEVWLSRPAWGRYSAPCSSVLQARKLQRVSIHRTWALRGVGLIRWAARLIIRLPPRRMRPHPIQPKAHTLVYTNPLHWGFVVSVRHLIPNTQDLEVLRSVRAAVQYRMARYVKNHLLTLATKRVDYLAR